MLAITAVYAVILAVIFIVLSVLTLLRRKKVQAAIGDADDLQLKRKIRAHGNFQEYVPISLILIACLESISHNAFLLHCTASLLVIGRMLHAYGVSQVKEKLIFRVTGMALTFTSMLTSCIGIIYYSL